MNKTHWKKLTNPNYLGSWCFQPGEEKVVTIREVKQEIVQNQNGKEECTVAYFTEDIKPMILNKTNSEMIARVLGTPYIEDWKNNKILLRVKKYLHLGTWLTRSASETGGRWLIQSCARSAGSPSTKDWHPPRCRNISKNYAETVPRR